ncbi:MAG: nickel-binding protein, partial [Thermosynechococcaceae cyanobacterium]
MSLVIVETAATEPLTDEYLHEADQVALPCLQDHNVTWRYSLRSLDRYRMLCIFDAPDAASVRDAYAKLGLQRTIWPSELIQSQTMYSQAHLTELYVIERSYPPMNGPT